MDHNGSTRLFHEFIKPQSASLFFYEFVSTHRVMAHLAPLLPNCIQKYNLEAYVRWLTHFLLELAIKLHTELGIW